MTDLNQLLAALNTPADGGPVALTGYVCLCGIAHSNIFDGGPWMDTEAGVEGFCDCANEGALYRVTVEEMAALKVQYLAEMEAYDGDPEDEPFFGEWLDNQNFASWASSPEAQELCALAQAAASDARADAQLDYVASVYGDNDWDRIPF